MWTLKKPNRLIIVFFGLPLLLLFLFYSFVGFTFCARTGIWTYSKQKKCTAKGFQYEARSQSNNSKTLANTWYIQSFVTEYNGIAECDEFVLFSLALSRFMKRFNLSDPIHAEAQHQTQLNKTNFSIEWKE